MSKVQQWVISVLSSVKKDGFEERFTQLVERFSEPIKISDEYNICIAQRLPYTSAHITIRQPVIKIRAIDKPEI